jgi:hypothetical protein
LEAKTNLDTMEYPASMRRLNDFTKGSFLMEQWDKEQRNSAKILDRLRDLVGSELSANCLFASRLAGRLNITVKTAESASQLLYLREKIRKELPASGTLREVKVRVAPTHDAPRPTGGTVQPNKARIPSEAYTELKCLADNQEPGMLKDALNRLAQKARLGTGRDESTSDKITDR